MKGIVSVDKAMRTYDYMKVRLDTFNRKYGKIVEEHKVREIAFKNAENAMVYMKCSNCGKMYAVEFSQYLKNPLIFKDWICFDCESNRIRDAEAAAVGTPRIYFRNYHRIVELTLPNRKRFYYGIISDGTLNGIQKRMTDMLGRKLYEVE